MLPKPVELPPPLLNGLFLAVVVVVVVVEVEVVD